jgi:DNA-binding MurR/RpiR family transcriptional regulator
MARRMDKISTTGLAGDIGGSQADARFAAHDVIGYLLDHESELSRSHAKIAQAILHHPTTFVEKPIEELVGWLGVSAPTITRFCRTIGCEGLRDLKLKVMSSMRVGVRYLEPATPPATLEEARQRVVMRAQRAILEAQRTVDAAMLERAIELLTRSRMIYAFGSGGVSSWLIEEIHNRLFRLGLRISTSNDHQMQMMIAATVERGDVVFCSSLSGNNEELIKAARIAADYGVGRRGAAGARRRRRRRCARADQPALRLPGGDRHAGLWGGDPEPFGARKTAPHQAAIHHLSRRRRHAARIGLNRR